MESVASNNTQAAVKNCPVFAGRSKESIQEYKSKLRVCLPTARPYPKCFKARPSHHHLLWAAPTPRRLMLSLRKNGYRRTKISGIFRFSPYLAPPTTPSRSSRGSGQTMERAMDIWRGRLSLRSTTATLRRSDGRVTRNSSTRRWSPARIRTTYFSFWTNALPRREDGTDST